jgi:hypothetical protein
MVADQFLEAGNQSLFRSTSADHRSLQASFFQWVHLANNDGS